MPRTAALAEPRPGPRPLDAVGPLELAERLDVWALQRDKVLRLLDPRAARQARELATACRRLGDDPGETSAGAAAWLIVRDRASRLLAADVDGARDA
jgi:hypothetical protein